jgi:hypothetical protein
MAHQHKAEFHQSLRNPHPECNETARQGFDEWMCRLLEEDAEELVDARAGKPVRWIPGEGWVEERK